MAKQETKNEAIVEGVDLEKANVEVEKAAEEMIENITNPANTRPIKLKKPIKNHNEEIKELTFDFDKLTTKDALEIENELISSSKNPVQRRVLAAFGVALVRTGRGSRFLYAAVYCGF